MPLEVKRGKVTFKTPPWEIGANKGKKIHVFRHPNGSHYFVEILQSGEKHVIAPAYRANTGKGRLKFLVDHEMLNGNSGRAFDTGAKEKVMGDIKKLKLVH